MPGLSAPSWAISSHGSGKHEITGIKRGRRVVNAAIAGQVDLVPVALEVEDRVKIAAMSARCASRRSACLDRRVASGTAG
jgi:hypothetical protein